RPAGRQPLLPRQIGLDDLRDALLVDGRADEVRERERLRVRVRDGDGVTGPFEQLDVVLTVAERDGLLPREPEPPGEELEPGALRHVAVGELEEVRQRLRDEEAAVEVRLHPHLERIQLERVADADELRRRPVEPREEVADRVDGELLELRVPVGLGRLARDIELVVDVDVEWVAGGLHLPDRVACQVERDRHVAQELARLRVGDDGALVADERVVEARVVRVADGGLVHAAGHDQDVQSRLARGVDRALRTRPELDVLAYERPVEVARERAQAAREIRGKDQLWVDWKTNAATSAICLLESRPLKEGIAPFPFVTRSKIRARAGFASSRFGPTVPCEFAAFSVWQPTQPALVKTA